MSLSRWVRCRSRSVSLLCLLVAPVGCPTTSISWLSQTRTAKSASKILHRHAKNQHPVTLTVSTGSLTKSACLLKDWNIRVIIIYVLSRPTERKYCRWKRLKVFQYFEQKNWRLFYYPNISLGNESVRYKSAQDVCWIPFDNRWANTTTLLAVLCLSSLIGSLKV